VAGVQEQEARLLMEQIMAAGSPEEAARLGRGAQHTRPHLVAPNWETSKLFVMYAGLQAKVPPPPQFVSLSLICGVRTDSLTDKTCLLVHRHRGGPLEIFIVLLEWEEGVGTWEPVCEVSISHIVFGKLQIAGGLTCDRRGGGWVGNAICEGYKSAMGSSAT